MLHYKVDPRKLAYDKLHKVIFAYFYKWSQFVTFGCVHHFPRVNGVHIHWKMVYTSKGCTLTNKTDRLEYESMNSSIDTSRLNTPIKRLMGSTQNIGSQLLNNYI